VAQKGDFFLKSIASHRTTKYSLTRKERTGENADIGIAIDVYKEKDDNALLAEKKLCMRVTVSSLSP